MNIELDFSNQAAAHISGPVVLFQQNTAAPFDAPVTVWKIIRNCAPGWHHPFIFPAEVELALNDEHGNFSSSSTARAGEHFSINGRAGMRWLARSGADHASPDIVVRNDMTCGALNVCLFRQRRLLAVRSNIGPGRTAAFRFDPLLWVAHADAAAEGAALNAAAMAGQATALPLLGIASAAIVMRGGGAGAEAEPLRFEFDSIALA